MLPGRTARLLNSFETTDAYELDHSTRCGEFLGSVEKLPTTGQNDPMAFTSGKEELLATGSALSTLSGDWAGYFRLLLFFVSKEIIFIFLVEKIYSCRVLHSLIMEDILFIHNDVPGPPVSCRFHTGALRFL